MKIITRYIKLKYSVLLSLWCLLLIIPLQNMDAQGYRIIKGTVLDQSSKEPLPGATVIIKNANDRLISGVVTDLDGRFTIKVPSDGIKLQASFVGYKSQDIPIASENTITFNLELDATKIDEVVVTGVADKSSTGFMEIDRRNLASSVTRIDINSIARSSATSVAEMIQGRATGVQITASSGAPGAGYNIKIRGTSSINSTNDPLIVVDDVPFAVQGRISSVYDITNQVNSPLADINPDDIESLEILKDAAATAQYGSRAANGVIIIKTKRGKANSTIINFSSNVSEQYSPANVPLLSGDDLKIFILEGEQNRGNTASGDYVPMPELRDDPTRNDYYYYNNNTNWMNEIQKNGFTYNNNLALRGGGNTTRYSFSVGTTSQTGNFNPQAYNRLTTNLNLDYIISKKLTFKTSVNYSRSKKNNGGEVGGFKTPIEMARRYPSFLPVHLKDKNGNDLDGYYIPNPRVNSIYPLDYYNPVAWTDYVSSLTYNNRFTANLGVVYEITNGVRFTSRVSVDFNENANDAFIPSAATNRDWNDALVNLSKKGNSNNQYVSQENLLSYSKTINQKHQVSAVVVSKLDWWQNRDLYLETSNSGSSLLDGFSATNVIRNQSSGEGYDVGTSLISQLHYVYNDKYILQGSYNYEGSSKFGPGRRFANFPTIAAAWRVSKENFLKNIGFIDEVIFKYSWGITGNAPRDQYLYFSKFDAGVRYLNNIGITPSNFQLNKLRWETTTLNNLILDATLFKKRFSFRLEVYDKYTKDLLMKRSLPSTSGFNDFWTNFGDIRNRGIEFSTDLRIIETKDFIATINFNISKNINKLEYLPTDNGISVEWNNGYPLVATQGDPIGAYYGFKYKGVFATDDDAVARDANNNIIYEMDGEPKKLRYDNRTGYIFKGGDAIYEDINHDGLINDLDRVQIGDGNPNIIGGFGTKISYKGWALDLFFQYQAGNDVINAARKQLESMTGGYRNYTNQAQSVLRRWRKQGDITDIPRVTFDANSHNAEGSDRFIEDGSYIRLKNIALSYNIPTKLLNKIRIKNAVFFVNVYNLITWTNYTGQDPEISISNSTPWAVGIDNNQTAVPKSLTTGIRLTL